MHGPHLENYCGVTHDHSYGATIEQLLPWKRNGEFRTPEFSLAPPDVYSVSGAGAQLELEQKNCLVGHGGGRWWSTRLDVQNFKLRPLGTQRC